MRPERIRLECGHWVVKTGEYPQRCPKCEAGHMRGPDDPYKSRREP